MSSVLKDITSFKKFQKTVEKKLFNLEKSAIFQQTNPNIYKVGAGHENGKSDFIFDLLKECITSLENKVSKKVAIIDHLTSQSPRTIKRIYQRMTLTRTKYPVIKLVSRVITKGIICKKWLLLETHYVMGLMNVDFPQTNRLNYKIFRRYKWSCSERDRYISCR